MALETGGRGTFGNIIAIIGFILIIAIGLWGATMAVRLAPRMLSSIADTFRGSSNSIEVSVPSSEIKSGETLVLSWTDTARESGLYTIRYNCTDGLSVEAPVSETAYGPIPCDMPYAIPATEKSVRLMPKLASGKERAEVTFTIAYLSREGEEQAAGTAEIAVVKGATVATPAPTPTPTPKPTPKPTPTPAPAPAPKPVGIPDLAVRMITMGVTDPYTGQFIPKPVFGSYEVISVKFEVANRGAGRSGQWMFDANLPTRTPYFYQSPIQMPLGPQDRIEFTLNFSQPISGPIQINVDPSNTVHETNESNNYLTQYVSVVY